MTDLIPPRELRHSLEYMVFISEVENGEGLMASEAAAILKDPPETWTLRDVNAFTTYCTAVILARMSS